MSENQPQPSVTQLLANVREGDRQALDRLVALVYDELRGLARRYLRSERRGHTLQTTALANEAYLRLAGREKIPWQDRAHFFAAAAREIRRILVDHARGKRRQKRGGGWQRVPLEGSALFERSSAVDLIALDEALDELQRLSSRQAQIVELKFFGGLTMPEIAEVLDVSLRTVEGDWSMARSWLRQQLEGTVDDDT
jgi:RNA polymerase sigma factor (TIGR02999 family)